MYQNIIILIIAGDFNAHLGIDHDNKFAYHSETNRTDIYLITS